MANEIRIRRNNIAGVTTDNPLTNVATTINSPGFVDLPTIDATSHLILILDPLELAGPAEIVRVTTHTAASSTVTVVRGAEGSAARTHSVGTTWFHGPVTSDTVEVLTSGTRPAVPYEGQLINETDTNKFVGFGGVDWASRDAGGRLASVLVPAITLTTSGTTESAIPGVTVTLTPPTGRRLKISGFTQATGTVAADQFDVRMYKDGVRVQISINTVPANNTTISWWPVWEDTPTAVSHTYHLTIVRRSGTGTATIVAASDAPNYLLVEDMGAA